MIGQGKIMVGGSSSPHHDFHVAHGATPTIHCMVGDHLKSWPGTMINTMPTRGEGKTCATMFNFIIFPLTCSLTYSTKSKERSCSSFKMITVTFLYNY